MGDLRRKNFPDFVADGKTPAFTGDPTSRQSDATLFVTAVPPFGLNPDALHDLLQFANPLHTEAQTIKYNIASRLAGKEASTVVELMTLLEDVGIHPLLLQVLQARWAKINLETSIFISNEAALLFGSPTEWALAIIEGAIVDSAGGRHDLRSHTPRELSRDMSQEGRRGKSRVAEPRKKSWLEKLHERHVSLTAEALSTADVADYVNKDNVLTESDFYEGVHEFDNTGKQLHSSHKRLRYIFHGLPRSSWTRSNWNTGFLRGSSETHSQLSREKAIYTTNSLAYGLMFGCYRQGTSDWSNPLWSYDSVLIVARPDVLKLLQLGDGKNPGLTLLLHKESPDDPFEKFVQENKQNGSYGRITPPVTSTAACNCYWYDPCECSMCPYPTIMAPFRKIHRQALRSYSPNFGGLQVHEIRQIAFCNDRLATI
jgi:hypothetical protein